MSVVSNQQRIFLRLASALRPHWRASDFPRWLQARLSGGSGFGSRDRRLYRELLYTTVRYLPWIEPLLDTEPEKAAVHVAWLAADLPATQAYRAAWVADWPVCPDSVAAKATHLQHSAEALLPDWLRTECPAAFQPAESDALHRRAPLWLRLQTDDSAPIAREFSTRGWHWRESFPLPSAWEVMSEADLTQTDAYQTGLFEIQDLGSQLILASAAISSGERWLDACAGAGGKTLQLARHLGPAGRVDAHDIRPAALDELQRRSTRAGLQNVQLVAAPIASASYDGVLVDAPCTGSGTWRRAPHLKWATTPDSILRHAQRQYELLARFAGFVRPGGQLLYATCSLNHSENTTVMQRFLGDHPGFGVAKPDHLFKGHWDGVGLTFLPSLHNTDGFYISRLRRA